VLKHVNRSLLIPPEAVSAGIAEAREHGTPVTINGPEDIATNEFVQELHDSGLLDRLSGGTLPRP